MFYQWPKFPKFSLFETLYIAIGHLFLSHLNILYALTTKVFIVKKLKKNNLCRHPYGSLNVFFFHETKS
jgi:hypothetical protein